MISSKERKSFVQDRLLHILFLSEKMSGRPCFAFFTKSVTYFLLWPPPVSPLTDLGHPRSFPDKTFFLLCFLWSWTYFHTYITFWLKYSCHNSLTRLFLVGSFIIYLLWLFYFFSHWIFCLNNFHHRESEDQILSRIGKLRGFNFWSILFLPRAVVWVVLKLNTFSQLLLSDHHLCSCLRSMWQKHWLGVKLGAKFKSCKIGN